MGKREEMKKAIESARLATAGKPFKYQQGVKPPKSQRSAAARDARSKTRGRLPLDAYFTSLDQFERDGKRWWGTTLIVPNGDGSKEFKHEANGLWQLLEEIDVMYWEWVAAKTSERKG